MTDREKIIKGLEETISYLRTRTSEVSERCIQYQREAIALLKEQEAVEPYQHDAVWLCGNCEKEVVGWDDDIDGKEYRYPFCRQCGKAVKWDGR